MANPFLGQIMLAGFNFAPVGWAFCSGQLLPISQNTALFSLLGTTYGGDGMTTFALPNLQGNVIVGQGQGPGLSFYDLGQSGGETTVSLLLTEIPAHTHPIPASAAPGHGSPTPGPSFALGSGGRGSQPDYATPAAQASAPATMSGAMCSSTGGSEPHNNLMPYLALNYVIALQGVYPSRS
jgi:microcystin-dependent protein